MGLNAISGLALGLTPLLGHFSGPFQSGLRNADIPMSCMPEKFRESLSHSYMMSPVAALEALVNGNDSGTLTEPWNPDIVAHFGDNIYEDMNCMQAWKVVPTSALVAALDTIRTRVLNFVLEIEAEAPEAGEAPANSSPVPQDRVQQIFNTYITGNVQNLANASPGAHQNATYNEQNPSGKGRRPRYAKSPRSWRVTSLWPTPRS